MSSAWKNCELRVPRDAGLVCRISWPARKTHVFCFGCGWSMDRPSLEDIHDHVTAPGFVTVEKNGRYFHLLNADGEVHRENGPAVVHEQYTRPGVGEWFIHGKRHRDDGPAVVDSLEMPEFHEWWFRGEQVVASVIGDEYDDLRRVLEDHEDASFLIGKLDALVMQSTLAGLVQGDAAQRVD